MSISTKSAMNVVRDLEMFGLAERQRDRITSTIKTGTPKDINNEISRMIATALNNHVLTILIRKNVSKESVIEEKDLLRLSDEAFQYTSLRDNTKRLYTLRLAKYLTSIRFLERVGEGWRLVDLPPGQLALMPIVRGKGIFLGDSPPEKVTELIHKLSVSALPRKYLEECHFRNALSCVIILGLAATNHGMASMQKDIISEDVESRLSEAIAKTRSFSVVSGLLNEYPNMPASEISRRLADELHLVWSHASYLRRGHALRRWAKWQENLPTKLK